MSVARTLITIAVCSVLCSEAASQLAKSPKDAAEEYHTQTTFQHMLCEVTLKNALVQAELAVARGNHVGEYPNANTCIAEARRSSKALLDKASASQRKPAAREALKSYHVAFITALEGLSPGSQERKIAYEARQQALKQKLTETWTRFEVER